MKDIKKLFSKTSVKIFIAIFGITSIVLAYISLFAISIAQNEFQNATIRFIDGSLFLVRQSPVAPVNLIRTQFNESLIRTIIFAGFMALIMALVTSIFFSLIITQPLRQIKNGISNLKKSKYKNKLKKTGESEFDSVIEEFNQLANELEYQETLRKDLISDVAHELKTPITAISTQTQAIIDGVFNPSKENLEKILKDVNRLNNLIDMLYEYTNLRSKFLKKNLTEINIKEFIDNIFLNFSNNKSFKFINNIEQNFVIKSDKVLLEVIINNIIDNAIKYSKGNTIKIYNNFKTLVIEDNGIGLNELELGKIFERFYRVEKSRNRKTGGLGLGLSIAKEIAESLNAQIDAQNNKEHSGLSFLIKFN